MAETTHDIRAADTLEAWQQALAEVPQTPALSGALLRRKDDLFGRFVAWYGRLRSRPRAERRRWQRQLGLSLAGIALLLAVNGAPAGAIGPAATITVTNGASTVANGDGCSLPEAIVNANADDQSGSTDCAAGSGADTISLSTNVTLTAVNNTTNGNNGLPVVTSAITIQGNNRTISRQAGSPDFRIMFVGSGGNLTLNSVTISGGAANGHWSLARGGGIFFGDGSSGTVSHSTISGNIAGDSGGGIYANHSTLTVSNSTLSANSAPFDGGGLYARWSAVTVSNSTVSGNSVSTASGEGGGISAIACGPFFVLNSTISGNRATEGAGIMTNDSTALVSDSIISGNSAGTGGGIHIDRGQVTVSNSTISGNSAGQFGGIYAAGGSVKVSNSTLSGNSVGGGGGGIGVGAANVTVENSTLSGNSASSGGGMSIFGSLAIVTVTNSTVSGNAASTGGGIFQPSGFATVRSSIVAGQASGGDCATIFISGGYNIESGTSCGFTGAGDLQNVSSASLALGALANNGGPTQTRALGAGSVAINRIPVGALEANGCGVTVTRDQRNAPRAGGAGNGGSACDVGAYEAGSTPLAVTLAGFDAQAMVDRILLTWETVSEANNAGFNLYRSASPAAPDALLAYVPSQAPGSTQGASYSFDDTAVAAGETWYYWLEDVDLNGATSLHGPVSATLQAPTAVTLDALEAQAANPGVTSWGALVAGLLAAAGALAIRQRWRAR